MVEARTSLYRFDFCADLTAAGAPVFHLGYLLEAAVHGGARFLGLASRVSLTRCELDLVSLETWPELEQLDHYMGQLFDRTWNAVDNAAADDLRLGSTTLAGEFGPQSALTLGKMDMPANLLERLKQDDGADWQSAFSAEVFQLGKLLKPTITAEVLPFAPMVRIPSADVRPKFRLEAA